MNKASIYVPVAFALLGGAAWGVSIMATSSERFSRFRPGETLQMRQAPSSDVSSAVGSKVSTSALEKPELDQSLTPPKAVVPEPVHNFGEMDPFSTAEHTFIIRNEGTSTLTLQAGPTTCKCTGSVVRQPRVAPGSEAQVEVGWRTYGRKDHYRHSATIYTNDPANPAIKLVIEGSVQAHLGAEPPDFTLPRVDPQKPTVATTVFYSQVWESFTIENFSCKTSGVTFKTVPAGAEQLEKFNAKAGYVLEVTLPADLPSGQFEDMIRFDVLHDGAKDEEPLEFGIGLQGTVLRRLSVKGEEIDNYGVVHIPSVNPNKGSKTRLLVKLNDSQLELPVKKITCYPEYVNVKLTPYLPEGKQFGLYYLDLEIPPGIPQGAFMRDEMGKVEIEFDHPRVEKLDLKLEYIVSPPE